MWTKGSRSRRSTPAKARRTGKPSPSMPAGAVVTERTPRSTTAAAGRSIFGRVRVSAVTAGTSRSNVDGSAVVPPLDHRHAPRARLGHAGADTVRVHLPERGVGDVHRRDLRVEGGQPEHISLLPRSTGGNYGASGRFA